MTTRLFPLLAPAACSALTLGIAGCAPSVDMARPEPLRSQGWTTQVDAGDQAGSIDELGWSAFNSPELDRLMVQALERNPEIDIALARVAQARGQFRATASGLLPTLDASLGVQADEVNAFSNAADSNTSGFGGLTIGWEADLFGQTKAEKRADAARLRATGLDAQSVRLLITSSVAQGWFDYCAFGARIRIVDRAIDNAAELERIIRIRYEEGVATRVDLGLQEIELRNLRAERSKLWEAQNVARTALAVLTGEEAPQFAPEQGLLEAFTVPAIASGQPTSLLTRRPDLRAAEVRIAAANGDIQAARRAFLPDLRIDVGLNGQGVGLGDPLTAGLSTVAGLFGPIFSGGRLRGNLDRVSGEQREAVAQYRLAVLEALAEAENAMVSVEQSRIRRQLLDEVVREARLTAELAREQYVGGIVDARTALEAERELLAAEDNFIIAQLESLGAVVDVHRAFGGRLDEQRASLTGQALRLEYNYSD